MSSPSFALSILNGQVKAAAFARGGKAVTWERPEPLLDFTALTPAIQEAVVKTKPSGKQVAIVLADARLSDQFVELPQARGATLARLLDRTANRVKAFQGDVTWSSQPAIPSKKGNSALLHLCPKAVLDQLLQSCHEANLELVRLLPTTAILVSHLKSLPIGKDEAVLLAAESGRSTTLVVGRKDGRLSLGRILPSSWNTTPDRVWSDVARSIGFAEQQSAITVTTVYLFGEGAEAQLPAAQAAVKTPVKLSPVAYTPFYWTEEAARLPEKEDGNLVSTAIRQAPQRQKFLNWTAVLVVLLLLGAIAAAGVMEFLRRNELKGVVEVNQQIKKLQGEKAELEKSYAEYERMRKTTEFVERELPPAPEWFLAYLGQSLPPELAVTRLRVVRTNDLWSVQMSGVAESRTNIAETFDNFCEKLSGSAFNLAITDSDLGKVEVAHAPPPSALQQIPGQIARVFKHESKLPPNAFAINGVMR